MSDQDIEGTEGSDRSETTEGSEGTDEMSNSLEENGRRPDNGQKIDRRKFIAAGAAAAVGAAGAAYFYTKGGGISELPRASDLLSHFVDGEVPTEDPEAEIWQSLPGFAAVLNPQMVTQPSLQAADVNEIVVRSVNNGKDIVFHLDWADAEVDSVEAIDRFRDAVAVQIPVLSPEPVVFMGQAGSPVEIFHWKASWQEDIDKGFHGVKKSYPNMFMDVTPEKQMGSEAELYYTGRYSGNILSETKHRSPVETMIAEGFGSATTSADQIARGRGVHMDGRWKVVIGISMNPGKEHAAIGPDTKKPVAFAVWSGSKQNRGARKQYTNWVNMEFASAVKGGST